MARKSLITLLALSLGLVTHSLEAKPLGATLTLAGDKPLACFVVSIDAENLKYGLDESGAGAKSLPLSQIKQIVFRAPDGWAEALSNFNRGDYAAAEGGFTTLANDYAGVASVRDQYGARARLYQLKCLKNNGKYDALATTLDSLKAKPIALGEHNIKDLQLLEGWALIGKKDWEGVIAYVAKSEDPGAQGKSPRVPFKKGTSRSMLAELSFLRGYSKLQMGQREAGLEDLSGAVGLNFGSDTILTKAALTAMLGQFKSLDEKDLVGRREAYALASYLKGVSGGTLDPAFAPYLKAPEMPTPAKAPATEGDGAAAPPAAAPAADDAAPAAEEVEKKKGAKKKGA